MKNTDEVSPHGRSGSKAGSAAFYVFLFVFVLFLVFTKRYYIKTGSMEPSHPIGSLVIVIPAKQLQVGDVGAYSLGDYTVIHRVVAVTPEGYQFKGDNNPTPDGEIIPEDRIIGKELLNISVIAPVIRGLRLVSRVRQTAPFLTGDKTMAAEEAGV